MLLPRHGVLPLCPMTINPASAPLPRDNRGSDFFPCRFLLSVPELLVNGIEGHVPLGIRLLLFITVLLCVGLIFAVLCVGNSSFLFAAPYSIIWVRPNLLQMEVCTFWSPSPSAPSSHWHCLRCPLPLPSPLATTNMLSVSVRVFSFLSFSYYYTCKWEHVIFFCL